MFIYASISWNRQYWFPRCIAIFGRILSGMKIVERLGAVAVDGDDRPREDIRIRKSSVVDLD